MISLVFLLALLLGPAIAALSVFLFLRWDRAYQRRLEIFRGMMRMRRVWLSPEWVGGLNLTPIEFARFPDVLRASEELLARYGDPAWKNGDQEIRRRAVLDTDTAACNLLMAMAQSLRIDLHGADLRARPLSPYGWNTDEVLHRQTQDLVMQVLSGLKPLRVEMSPAASHPVQMTPPPSLTPTPIHANGGWRPYGAAE